MIWLWKLRENFDESIPLADNAMLKIRPELFYEWDFEKNREMDVYEATRGSHKIVWWKCSNCKSSYEMKVSSRSRKGSNCPYCSGKRANWTNSLAALNPELAAQWHPTKNGDLTPHDRTEGSGEKVWWLGKCGHEWDAVIHSRASLGCNCSICDGKQILIGFNDMWTTNPELAKLLLNPNDGYRYMQNSNVKVDWKCSECENIVKNKEIYNVNIRGLNCPMCSDGMGFPEKYMYGILKESGVNFIFDEKFDWSQGKRYDFHLPDYNWIIEVHGVQHYRYTGRGRTLEEERENDRIKYELAKESGINDYIVIDARESTVDWIKDSIANSELSNIINGDIDFEKIGRLASKSFVKVVCDLWNSNSLNINEISEKVSISRVTVRTYLKRGAEIGWCNYTTEQRIPIVQLSLNLDFISEWDSNTSISQQMGLSIGNIVSVCRGNRNMTGNFKWMYKEDYDKMLQEDLSHKNFMSKYYPKTK